MRCDCGTELVIGLDSTPAGYYISHLCKECGPQQKLSEVLDMGFALTGLAMEQKVISLEFDGACEPRNPGGIATFGWRIVQHKQQLAYGYGEVCRGKEATNNVAEYTALIRGLEAISDLGIEYEALIIKGDSQLVIYQLDVDPRYGKSWACRSKKLQPLKAKVESLLPWNTYFWWRPREFNQEADNLSKQAYSISRREKEPWYKRFKTATL